MATQEDGLGRAQSVARERHLLLELGSGVDERNCYERDTVGMALCLWKYVFWCLARGAGDRALQLVVMVRGLSVAASFWRPLVRDSYRNGM